MAFTKLTENLEIISALDDQPNDTGGLSSTQLKAKFDEGTGKIKIYLNSILIGELEGTGGAGNIGITSIPGVTGAETVQEALEKLQDELEEITQGAVSDSSITTQKLADAAVTAAKLASLCVGSAAIASNAVTDGKIANNAVSTSNISNSAVTTAKIANENVTAEKLAAKSVTTLKVADRAIGTAQIDDVSVTESKIGTGAVTTVKIGAGAVTADKLSHDAIAQVFTTTLNVENWSVSAPYSQEIVVEGLSAGVNGSVDVDLADISSVEDGEAMLESWGCVSRVYASEINALTAICFSNVPTVDIPIRLIVFGNAGPGNSIAYYSGSYNVTPSEDAQTLETDNLVMTDDVEISGIPSATVSNESGQTVIIG